MDNLFSTHPNTENRIAALENLAEQWGQLGNAAYAASDTKLSLTGDTRSTNRISDDRDTHDQGPLDQGPWDEQSHQNKDDDKRGPWG